MRVHEQKRLCPEPLNSYSPLVQWDTVRLRLIFQCIIGLQSQIIDFTNAFSQSDIPSRYPVSVELPRYFNIYGGKCDAVIGLNKSLYDQDGDACLCYEKL